MTVRRWWDNTASSGDQAKVLRRLDLDEEMAGVPWAFLPTNIQAFLVRRLRITLPDDGRADSSSR